MGNLNTSKPNKEINNVNILPNISHELKNTQLSFFKKKQDQSFSLVKKENNHSNNFKMSNENNRYKLNKNSISSQNLNKKIVKQNLKTSFKPLRILKKNITFHDKSMKNVLGIINQSIKKKNIFDYLECLDFINKL